MSNFDDWELYTKYVSSPQEWVDASFYFMVSAALQRRVWYGGLDAHPIFPNMYMTFIGSAGMGKSLPVTAMKSILDIPLIPPGDAPVNTSVDDLKAALQKEHRDKHHDGEVPLVHFAPNSTSFEQLTQETARTVFVHRYVDGDGKAAHYSHSSLVFVLDELTSIFKKHSEDLTNFLLEAFNGSKKYVRKLKHAGTDYCTNICVSMIGNTTDDKFRSMQNTDILTDGFMSRSIIVYAQRKRFGVFMIPDLTPEQRAAMERLRAHMRKLGKLYGPLQFAPGVLEFCEDLFKRQDPSLTVNKHPMLKGYYERKNIHFMKLLAAVHFADKDDMVITQDEVDFTLKLMAKWEKHMHTPFVGLGRNESAKVLEDIFDAINKAGEEGISKKRLFARFYTQCKTKDEFETIISDLKELERIEERTKNGEGILKAKHED